ncbi:MAG: hypothetical protein IKY10_04550 [Clostridia bacterium]|nr:hypothetical protein [Clostridia bacterium]
MCINLDYGIIKILFNIIMFFIFFIIYVINHILNKKYKKQEQVIIIKHQPVIKWLGLTCCTILTITFTYLLYVNEIPRNFIGFSLCGVVEILCLFLLLIGFNTQIIISKDTLHYINFLGIKKIFILSDIEFKKVYSQFKSYPTRVKIYIKNNQKKKFITSISNLMMEFNRLIELADRSSF